MPASGACRRRAKLVRYGGDCYAYCLLAMGLVDVVIESSLKAWDVQALIPIVEAAGGVITGWDGGRCDEGGDVVACGDPALAPAVRVLLAGVRLAPGVGPNLTRCPCASSSSAARASSAATSSTPRSSAATRSRPSRAGSSRRTSIRR